MALLLSALSFFAVAAVLALLIRRGFQDGDKPGDARVHILSIRRPLTGPGGWIEVDVSNPGTSTALVALRLRGGRLGQARQRLPKRRAYSSRRAVSLAEQMVGAVDAGTSERFWLWSEREPREQIVRVLVGTSGRLRLHTLPVQRIDMAWPLVRRIAAIDDSRPEAAKPSFLERAA